MTDVFDHLLKYVGNDVYLWEMASVCQKRQTICGK